MLTADRFDTLDGFPQGVMLLHVVARLKLDAWQLAVLSEPLG